MKQILNHLFEHKTFSREQSKGILINIAQGKYNNAQMAAFNASHMVPKMLSSNKKTVGIRVPDNNIAREIVRVLGNPILSTSIRDDDDIIEYSTDPELIHEKYEDLVDIVIDGGYGDNIPSTIVDCTTGDFDIVREGKGDLELYL